jgi:murein DD-endopeptidase MepM/ murein hydrolase activator NlpD
MMNFAQKRIITTLLSMLLLASTASVRGSLADDGGQLQSATETAKPAAILATACEQPADGTDASAAYAAERLRYDAGLVAETSRAGELTRSQKLTASFAAANRVVQTSLVFDTTQWEASLQPFDTTVYDSYAQRADEFMTLADRFNAALQQASVTCMHVLSRELREIDVPLYTGGAFQTKLDWRQCAALYYAFGTDMNDILAQSIVLTKDGGIDSGITLVWSDPDFDTIASQGTREQLFEARMALAYFKTVYNDDGSVAQVEHYAYSKEYLSTVAHPLPGGTIKNGWYDPRSRRTRLHVGTDIRASARTPILSTTDGTVLYVGFMPIPGNFVIVVDPFGYEYHYYHMYEISTFVSEGDTVKQGQQIGRVGSTGNSVAYHLHLGLVSPDGRYLNPYDLFVQAGIGPIQSD